MSFEVAPEEFVVNVAVGVDVDEGTVALGPEDVRGGIRATDCDVRGAGAIRGGAVPFASRCPIVFVLL